MASVPSAKHLIEKILDDLGVPARPVSVDAVLDGDPQTPVGAVVVTMMATLPVLAAAAERGPALVITHEPVYFDHANGAVAALQAEDDPVYRAKRELIAGAHLVVWHLHDHLHDHLPDLIDVGTLRALGWPQPGPEQRRPVVVDVPPTRLGALADHVARTLGAHALRVIGDPELPVRRVGLNLGFCGADINRATLQRSDVDALLIGEAHEWETGEYAADLVATGAAKGLIVAGHIASEQQGMADLARRLDGVGLGVPVVFVPAEDPYR
jgi:putative NIF3 family GTP cyclohydrolase 1 type 2